MSWEKTESAPLGTPVLLTIEDSAGRRKVIRAVRADERTLPLAFDQDPDANNYYDEDADTYYCAPGWYETNEFEECNWFVHAVAVAWQPLPEPAQ